MKRDTAYKRKEKRKKFSRRAALEPVIGHLKTEFRMGQNYLHGTRLPQMNAFLVTTSWNLKKMMRQLKEEAIIILYFWFAKLHTEKLIVNL